MQYNKWETELATKEKILDIVDYHMKKGIDDAKSVVVKKSVKGLCKTKMTGAQMKEKHPEMKKEVEELRANMKSWEDAAGSESNAGETKMEFTGKCIIIFKDSEDAGEAGKRFNHLNTQNCLFNCLLNCFCVCRYCGVPKFVDKEENKHTLYVELADEPSDI